MRLLAVSLLVISLGYGCADECATTGDCKASDRCTDGKCVPRDITPPPMFTDAGPRPDARTQLDAAAPDALVGDPDAASDGGTVVMRDAGDSDGGVVTAGDGSIERVGRMQLSQVRTASGTVEQKAFATFYDHAAPAIVDNYTAMGVSCDLIDRAGPRGVVFGYNGSSVTVEGFIAPFDRGLVLDNVAAGVWVAEMFSVTTFFPTNQRPLAWAIADSVIPGHIDQLPPTDIPTPRQNIDVQTPVHNETPIAIAAPIEILWNPVAMSGFTVVAEIYSRPRDVVLRCVTTDTGRLMIPPAARTAFLAKSPVAPLTFEIGYETTAAVRVPIVGSTLMIPTTIRQLYGLRWNAQ